MTEAARTDSSDFHSSLEALAAHRLTERVALDGAITAVRPFLPEAAYFSENQTVGETAARYIFVFWKDSGRWVLLPARGKIDESLLENTLATNRSGLFNLFDAPGVTQQTLFLHNAAVGKWPLVDRPKPISLFCMTAGLKCVAFFLDRESGEPLSVVKLPLSRSIAGPLSNEAKTSVELSNQYVGVAPWIVYKGNIQRQAAGQTQPYYMYEYLSGNRLTAQSSQTALAFLQQLQQEALVSPVSIATALAARLPALTLDSGTKAALADLLAGVADTREYAASIVHGDFRPDNLVQVDAGTESQALDWKFSREQGLGFIDFIQFALDGNYNNPQVTSWADLYSTEATRLIEASLTEFYSADRPALLSLLVLQFCQYFVDRIECLSQANSNTLARMETMLRSENLIGWLTHRGLSA